MKRERDMRNEHSTGIPSSLHTHTSSASLCPFYVTLSLPKQLMDTSQVLLSEPFGYSTVLFFVCCCCFSLRYWFRIAQRQEGQWRKTCSPSLSSALMSPTCFPTCFLVWLWCPEERLAEVWSHQVLVWGIVPLYSVEATSFFTHPFIQQAFAKHLLCQEWV